MGKDRLSAGRGRRLASPTPGPEDIALDPATGLAYVACDARALALQKRPRGAIYACDLNAAEPTFEDLTSALDAPSPFHPLGVALWTGEGAKKLFVVNYPSEEASAVEIFDVKAGRLAHEATIRDGGGLMHHPNDVAPVDGRRFYVSNYVGSTSCFGQLLETVFERPQSYVLYYDGNAFRKVADGLRYVNGLALSPSGQTLYATATLAGELYRYDRADDGSLALRETIDLGTGGDNLTMDTVGDLWIGCQPNPRRFALYALRKQYPWLFFLPKHSPSQVLRLYLDEVGRYDGHEEIYRDDGRNLSASSVAVHHGHRLLVGSVFEHLLLCDLAESL